MLERLLHYIILLVSVGHGFELVVILEGVVAVVQDVRAVPDDAAPGEHSSVLAGGHSAHVVDEPRTLLVVVQLKPVRVGDLAVVCSGVESVYHHVPLLGVLVQLRLIRKLKVIE